MADVSIGTVDRVLHNRGDVSRKNRELITSIIETHGYTPNLNAKSLALKKHFIITVLIPGQEINNPYWKKPAEGLKLATTELKDFNTRIIIFKYNPGEESSFIQGFESMLKQNPDGIIIAPHFHNAAISYVRKCKELNIPVIYLDNNLEEEEGLAYFGQDAFQSGRVAARLMSYHLSKQSTVLIVNPAPNKVVTHHMQRREHGFTDYFHSDVSELNIKIVSVAIDILSENEPFRTMSEAISVHPDTRGIFVTNSRASLLASFISSARQGKTMLIGYDAIRENISYLKKGVIDLLICQKPRMQGYLSAVAMFNFLFTGKQVKKVNYSPIDIIMKENINYYQSYEDIYKPGLPAG